MDELVRLTATEAVELLERGKVSPLEMVEAAARRIEQTNPAINAMATLCLDRARERARRMQSERPADAPPHYLYGLPIAVKDNLDVAGVRTTHGSRVFEQHIAAKSDIVVERLERHGAIVVGKSNLPEFAAGGHSFNDIFGATVNPWNTATAAGGSSGGSAAALAAGQVWLATGNDFGGSIRLPASFCSIVGFRPSPGLVPRQQKQPFTALSVEGPMARTVRDAALMFDAEVGWHPLDPLTQPCDGEPYSASVRAPALPRRVAYSADLGIAPVHPEVRRVCDAAAERIAAMGAQLTRAHPDLADAEKNFEILRGAIYVGRVGPLLAKYRDVIKPECVENAEYGLRLAVSDVVAAEMAHGELIRRVARFFEQHDLLVCPAVLCPPIDASKRYLEELDGHRFETYLGWLVLTYAISMTCCPSISIPCGFTADGLPIGLQMVAPPRGERMLLSAAAYLEEAFDVQPRTPIDPRPPR
jgi:amidase